MGLTQDNATKRYSLAGQMFSYAVKAGQKIWAGALAMVKGGYAYDGATGVGYVAAGVCELQADNSAGADGDISVTVREGIFNFLNSAAADAIDNTMIGNLCYIVDDQTVAATNGTNTRSMAGRIKFVDTDGTVWVKVGTDVE